MRPLCALQLPKRNRGSIEIPFLKMGRTLRSLGLRPVYVEEVNRSGSSEWFTFSPDLAIFVADVLAVSGGLMVAVSSPKLTTIPWPS